MTDDKSFDRVRDRVLRDLTPTTPLRPASVGALVVLPLALVLLSWILLVYGLRSDAAALGFWPLWGPAAAMVAAAYAIVYLALVQRAPESTVSWVFWVLVPLAAIGLQIGSGFLTLVASGLDPVAVSWRNEAMCFLRISLMSVPPLLAALWFLSRGLPLWPRIAGLFAGLGGGFLAEGIYRLFCGLSSPAHMIPWHTGSVIVIGVLGLLAGLWWERRAVSQWIERRA